MTINDIIRESRERGSHFFDADTMRYFDGRVLPQVYRDEAGTRYFVTSEQFDYGEQPWPRKFTVRRFAADGAIFGSDEFQKHATAEDAAAEIANTFGATLESSETPVLPTDHDDLARAIEQHAQAHTDTARRAAVYLMRYAAKLHQLAEDDCNYGLTAQQQAAKRRTIVQAKKYALMAGCAGIETSGDPRGCVLKLVFPDGATNGFGEGWGVAVL